MDKDPEDSLQKNLRDRTKSCGDVPRRLFLPFSSRVQVSSSFKFHVFLLLQPFLNVCYFTLLAPFRFRRNAQGVYIIQVNPVQQVLSTVLIFSAVIYSLLDLRYWVEQNLKEKPHQAFRFASYLLRGFMPLFWCFTFWLKRKWFSKLLVVCQGKRSYQNLLLCPKPSMRRNVKPSWKLRVGVTVLMVLSITKSLWDSSSWDSFESLVIYNVQVTLYNLYQYDNWDACGKEASRLWSMGSRSPLIIGVGYSGAFLYMVDQYVEHMFDLLCFIGGAMVYAVCSHFADEMEKLSRSGGEDGDNSSDYLQSKRILKSMQTNYIDLMAILDSINEVFGSLIVLYFLRSYPTLVWCVFGLFRKVHYNYVIFYLHKILIFILVTVTAAEGNSKVGQFKQWLFRTSLASLSNENKEHSQLQEPEEDKSTSGNVDLASLNILHREVSTETLGLKGYKFFTVTHGLIGTMLGIVVTYAIVMLQFEMDAEEAKRTSTLSTSNGKGNGSGSELPPIFIPYLRKLYEETIENMTEQFNQDIFVNQFEDIVDI